MGAGSFFHWYYFTRIFVQDGHLVLLGIGYSGQFWRLGVFDTILTGSCPGNGHSFRILVTALIRFFMSDIFFCSCLFSVTFFASIFLTRSSPKTVSNIRFCSRAVSLIAPREVPVTDRETDLRLDGIRRGDPDTFLARGFAFALFFLVLVGFAL